MAPDISDTCLKAEFDLDENKINGQEERVKRGINGTENGKLSNGTSQITPAEQKKGYFGEELKWGNIFHIVLWHLIALYGVLTFSFTQNWKTSLWIFLASFPPGFGVTGGAHRYWTHKAYKAKLPLRIILLICYCWAGQNTLYDWVRDHRVHHKYSETDADPHNSKRGFFFAHVGWLMMRKHPDVIKKGQQIDMSDVLADPVVQFGEKHFKILKILFAFVLPTLVPVLLWNETWGRAIMSQCFIRYIFTLNCTWSVNSAAHIWGNKPYDKTISPAENWTVAVLALGEGWHNYHHVFPWDYKAAELGPYIVNFTSMMIDMFAKIGWAYDLRQPSDDLVKLTASRRGDGTHPVYVSQKEEPTVLSDKTE